VPAGAGRGLYIGVAAWALTTRYSLPATFQTPLAWRRCRFGIFAAHVRQQDVLSAALSKRRSFHEFSWPPRRIRAVAATRVASSGSPSVPLGPRPAALLGVVCAPILSVTQGSPAPALSERRSSRRMFCRSRRFYAPVFKEARRESNPPGYHPPAPRRARHLDEPSDPVRPKRFQPPTTNRVG
jgi:hypothetical protein